MEDVQSVLNEIVVRIKKIHYSRQQIVQEVQNHTHDWLGAAEMREVILRIIQEYMEEK